MTKMTDQNSEKIISITTTFEHNYFYVVILVILNSQKIL
jgi:hypothetical protein